MFIEKQTLIENGSSSSLTLAFIKSLNVQAYPCGRRRSEEVQADETTYHIPYDPEARLNTEANNRKLSSLNGYTQSYINRWNILDDMSKKTDFFSLVIAGYLFDIKLDRIESNQEGSIVLDYQTINDIGSSIAGDSSANYIYANIRLENTALFQANDLATYKTTVLRNQTNTATASTTLDMLATEFKNENQENQVQSAENIESNPNNYFFSGLSFSTQPLAEVIKDFENDERHYVTEQYIPSSSDSATYCITNIYIANNENEVKDELYQQVISLRILDRVESEDAEGSTTYKWQICQHNLLPEIRHGATENSIILNNIAAESLKLERLEANNITHKGKPVCVLRIGKTMEGEVEKAQLNFYSAAGSTQYSE